MLNNLKQSDPDIYGNIQAELERQRNGLEMIASENFTSEAVMEATGSVLTNKYSEGYPHKRYYGGNEYIDKCEDLARDRAKELFNAEHANVQSHAGSQANAQAYFAVLNTGDKILAMDLSAGGHLTHGHPVSFSGKQYNFVHYGVDPQTQLIDMNEVRKIALAEKPKMILAGASAYPRAIDFQKFREVADEIGAYLMVDMAHIAGLVAAKLHPDPIPYADIVATTTHKTLRGPRGAMILCKTEDRINPKDKKNLAQKIDSAVFPGMQGGPLDHVIAAKAVALAEALKPEFTQYQKQVLANAKVLEAVFKENNITMVSGGTDNHLLLLDLTNLDISGQQAVTALDSVGIFTNKNMIPFDKRKPTDPSGIRLGTAALTTRGIKEDDMKLIGQFIVAVLKNIDKQDVLDNIKKQIGELIAKYPLYPNINYG
ncbi:MAG: serine hydroxymethyltransferase [Candidatus Komeilibacteria bacterium CG_4_9_14_0_8_um_filter_36_9]|uniref:Serine hydroxymethyltransferase n=1 Tax=Candidatus Komeilibacteria bacterium CG_4_9_14_0_8_um_filter_36_9 TaxID=1974473 RepID=A0A2M8DRC7_9BACT|nr:MAG: serine hydroxymethyltransferase [Candidatus Komeilibacteria bacterium CG_4_9_14_0_8_um_filter_36_9]